MLNPITGSEVVAVKNVTKQVAKDFVKTFTHEVLDLPGSKNLAPLKQDVFKKQQVKNSICVLTDLYGTPLMV